ncbi:MAG: hypothetical protein B6244_12185 [Candidatus Cloacimonetes bacterium 4572_55]|nr:MAG: hypothetical protein B6244_12185 [Candidatus Cloacimonetes bacterium 4572_55]
MRKNVAIFWFIFFVMSLVNLNPALSQENTRDLDYTVYAYNAWDPSGTYPAGVVSFTLNNPGHITFIAETPTEDMMAASTFIQDVWYAIEFYSGDLYTITTDGQFSLIGGNGVDGDAIAYDDNTETLYCVELTDLYSIDIATGHATLIGPIGNTAIIIAMACDNDGNLYGIDMIDDNLYSIDPLTGAGTIIGPLGIDINFAQDMSYDKDDDVCYLAGFGGPGRLYSIDVDTGHATTIGDFQNSMEISAFAIPYGFEDEPGWISGTVTLDGGNGIVTDVEVSADQSSTVNPDNAGAYILELDSGSYNVTASLDGYNPVTVENVTVEDGAITDNIDFTLIAEGPGTEISGGNVSGNWSIDGSPYLIQGEITIPIQETLTIDPGVSVRFQGHYKLIVLGRLLAIGAEDEMIHFTADNVETGWHAIRFESTSAANDSSKIIFCHLEQGNAYTDAPGPFNGAGGAIAIIDFDKLIISDCLIENNRANSLQNSPGGAGIAMRESSPIITRNIIRNNSTEAVGGGMLIMLESHPIISYNLIYDNYALWDGGGIECYHESSPEIFNNTIVYNTADEAGGGIDFYTNCSPNLTNNILWGNTAPHGNQAFLYTDNVVPNFYYNNVQGGLNAIGLNYGVTFDGDYENNISADALFVNASADDYHLTENSPCIDAGDPLFPLDPDSTISDIGALYYPQSIGIEDRERSYEDFHGKNYPNPFTFSTTIGFSTSSGMEKTEISIYNLTGQKVKTLVHKVLPAGSHSVTWDGNNDNGVPVASGIYLTKIECGAYLSTRKMTLLR